MEQKIAPKIAPKVAPKVVPKVVPNIIPVKIVPGGSTYIIPGTADCTQTPVSQIVHGPQIIQIIQAPPVQAPMQIVQVRLGENFENNETINAEHFKTELNPQGTKISVMEQGGDLRTRVN